MHAHYLPPRLGIEIYGADTSDLLQISLMATTASASVDAKTYGLNYIGFMVLTISRPRSTLGPTSLVGRYAFAAYFTAAVKGVD